MGRDLGDFDGVPPWLILDDSIWMDGIYLQQGLVSFHHLCVCECDYGM